jgi:hypothetical protein
MRAGRRRPVKKSGVRKSIAETLHLDNVLHNMITIFNELNETIEQLADYCKIKEILENPNAPIKEIIKRTPNINEYYQNNKRIFIYLFENQSDLLDFLTTDRINIPVEITVVSWNDYDLQIMSSLSIEYLPKINEAKSANRIMTIICTSKHVYSVSIV